MAGQQMAKRRRIGAVWETGFRAAQKFNIIGPGWQQVGCALRSCQGTSH